jgi:predicted ArsR family transcriptional regulator
MTNTKLEEYIAITKIVAHQGPLNFQQLSEHTDLEPPKLKEHIEFLIEQGVITTQKQPGNSPQTYTASTRGIKVLKFFNLNEPIKNDPNNLAP